MKRTAFLGSALDFIESLLKWLAIWWLVASVVSMFLVLIVAGLNALGLQSVAMPLLVLSLAVAAIAALVDLYFRMRGLPSLLSILYHSRAARVVSAAVDSGEKLFVSTASRVAKLIGYLLLAILLVLLAYWLFRGIAAVPISVAIIIGAMIIANAHRRE
jgi:hypothetical protein